MQYRHQIVGVAYHLDLVANPPGFVNDEDEVPAEYPIYFNDGRAPIDNNNLEREIRVSATGKNHGCSATPPPQPRPAA